MAVVEPNYKICRDQAMKKRLHALKSNIEDKIKNELQNVKSVVCTTDGWSSIAQNSYISLTANIIDNQWSPKSFTLATQEMAERHTAVNLVFLKIGKLMVKSLLQIASLLDPRYKDLEFEPNFMREKIRMAVKDLLERFDEQEMNLEQITPVESSDLEYLYGNTITADDNLTNQLQIYIAEPPLRFDLNPYEWWKSRENKYSTLVELAKQYLAIPATSACMSSTGVDGWRCLINTLYGFNGLGKKPLANSDNGRRSCTSAHDKRLRSTGQKMLIC
ncbi:hypothetical protein QTP88_020079 [Uroleucon formosanum]